MGELERSKPIGLDRIVRLAWMEHAAALVARGGDDASIEAHLLDYLQPYFPSSDPTRRGSLSKTKTILLRTWARPPESLVVFRNRGLDLLGELPKQSHIAIHWGMLMAVYPFWREVADHVGRLIRLQGSLTSRQVQQRLRESYGERETVSRRVRYLLRSYIDWGVLADSKKPGEYLPGLELSIHDLATIEWMLEAYLRSKDSTSAQLDDIKRSPSFFPFKYEADLTNHLAMRARHLELLSLGSGQLVVALVTGS